MTKREFEELELLVACWEQFSDKADDGFTSSEIEVLRKLHKIFDNYKLIDEFGYIDYKKLKDFKLKETINAN